MSGIPGPAAPAERDRDRAPGPHRGSRRRAIYWLTLALILSGCGREERGPILLGGRDAKSWLEDLHSTRPQVRRQAVLKLSNVGDADPAVVEGLVGALGDPDALVRRDAIVAATRLKDAPPTVWERLEAMSRADKDARARELAGKAVARHGGQ